MVNSGAGKRRIDLRRLEMRFLSAVLILTGAGSALAHTPGASYLSDYAHQLTSLHHLPAAVLLAVLVTLLVIVARRNRSTH
jgi:hypothetical protein